MSKRTIKQPKNEMEIDFEALLMSEESEKEIFSPEKHSSSKGRKKVKYSNPPKTEKPKHKQTKEPEDDDESLNISKTVEDFKNDFAKPIKAKKVLLEEFTRQVAEVYQAKAAKLAEKQASEEKKLQKAFMNEIDKELKEWTEDMNTVMKEEQIIVKMLQRHLNIMETAKNSTCERKKNLSKIAKSYEARKEELMVKQESEIGGVLESAKKEISELQSKVIADIQKEEMASMKRLLCSGVFF